MPTYDSATGSMVIGTYGYLREGCRCKIEHLPQFLDTADEFYLDADTGYLFYRPETGVRPNDEHLELNFTHEVLNLGGQSHIEVSNLQFSIARTGIQVQENTSDQITTPGRWS
ncbi:MAG: hypothetical protein ACOCXA_02625 [Planctomycetota bacterium]